MTKEIKTRADILFLINTFYGKVRKDALIGPIFNQHIGQDEWPDHINKLTDFWESSLFNVRTFSGNPMHVHQQVDRNMNHSIEQKHFGVWLNIWHQNIDEHFKGELAYKAKKLARRMSTVLYTSIWKSR